MTSGYYRFPTICQDTIVFVSEDDLWTVPATGGIARRVTSNLGEVNYPALSPTGEWLAFVGRDEGRPEVYLMPGGGGSARRLTYLNSPCQVLGWSRDGRSVVFASAYGQVHAGTYGIFSVAADVANGSVQQLPVGLARSIAFGPDGAVVIGRGPRRSGPLETLSRRHRRPSLDRPQRKRRLQTPAPRSAWQHRRPDVGGRTGLFCQRP